MTLENVFVGRAHLSTRIADTCSVAGPAKGRSSPLGAAMGRSLRAALLSSLLVFQALQAIPALAEEAAPPGTTTESATPVGVAWQEITLDEAIAQAKEKETMVLLDVWAAHCHSCGQMDEEVWTKPEGIALAEGLVPIKIDTQTPAGRDVMKRMPITGLPAIIFLKGDGSELDRVEGYTGADAFLRAAQPIRDGLDPLEGIEAAIEKSPSSLPLLMQALERYLFRQRMADADSAYQRILRIDAQNAMNMAEQAMRKMARFEENFRQDYGRAADYNKQMAERFPNSASVGGAVDGTFKALMRAGRSREWVDWICPLLEKNPQSGTMHRAAAMTALHNGFRSPCFAQAARTAARLNVGKPAFMDSIAVILEGSAPQKP